MSAILVISSLLVSAAPAPPVQSVQAVDAAYEEVAAHRNAEAIARIDGDHPAQLINLGIAYAREGNSARARALFQRAAHADEGYSLETASGEWTTPRAVARRALAALESGRLAGATRTARR